MYPLTPCSRGVYRFVTPSECIGTLHGVLTIPIGTVCQCAGLSGLSVRCALPALHTSPRGHFQGNTMIVLPMLRSMTSSNGMVWFDGALIPLRYFNNRHSLESTIVLRMTETPLCEVAWLIVGLSFDELLVRPAVSRCGVNHDLQESVM
jgi:hypothetical protein